MQEMEFKEILSDYLVENGLTQTAFAKIVGTKQSQVSAWITGKAKPGYDMLKQMSLSLNVSPSYWLGLSDYK